MSQSRRPFWRIHLLTLLLLSFVVDGIIFINLKAAPTRTTVQSWSNPKTGESGLSAWSETSRGWPCEIMKVIFGNNYPQSELTRMGITDKDELLRMDAAVPDCNLFMGVWQSEGLAVNIAVFVPLIGLATFLCEWLIRRKRRETYGNWQFRLLTAVLLMFTVGVLLWMNIGSRMTFNNDGVAKYHRIFGWPYWIFSGDSAASFATVFDAQFAISTLCVVAYIPNASLAAGRLRIHDANATVILGSSSTWVPTIESQYWGHTGLWCLTQRHVRVTQWTRNRTTDFQRLGSCECDRSDCFCVFDSSHRGGIDCVVLMWLGGIPDSSTLKRQRP